MSTIRTLAIVAVLGVVGYGVYVTLTVEPPGEPPVPIPENLGQGPEVSLQPESDGMPVGVPNIPWSSGGGDAPAYDPGQADTSRQQTPSSLTNAPHYNPQASVPGGPGSDAQQAGNGTPAPLVPGAAFPPGEPGESTGGSATSPSTPHVATPGFDTHSSVGRQTSGVVPVTGVGYSAADVQGNFSAVWSRVESLLEAGNSSRLTGSVPSGSMIPA